MEHTSPLYVFFFYILVIHQVSADELIQTGSENIWDQEKKSQISFSILKIVWKKPVQN